MSTTPREFTRDFDTVSLVLLFAPTSSFSITIRPEFIEHLEEQLGAPASFTQSLDALLQIQIPRYQLDLTLAASRLEVRSRNPEFSEAVAHRLVQFLDLVVPEIDLGQMRSIGHNFVWSTRSTNGPAIKLVADKLLKTGLSRNISQTVLGASVGLWIEVDESTLLLRIDPRRRSGSTELYETNANFSVDVSGSEETPDSATIVTRLVKYCRSLDGIIEGLDL